MGLFDRESVSALAKANVEILQSSIADALSHTESGQHRGGQHTTVCVDVTGVINIQRIAIIIAVDC